MKPSQVLKWAKRCTTLATCSGQGMSGTHLLRNPDHDYSQRFIEELRF
jgi:hypothetical protein